METASKNLFQISLVYLVISIDIKKDLYWSFFFLDKNSHYHYNEDKINSKYMSKGEFI